MGKCPQGKGYPEGRLGPTEVCPECRGYLTWHGRCWDCHNAGRRNAVPGHRYELEAGHWVVVHHGPIPVDGCLESGCTMSLEQHKGEALKAIRQMLAAMEAL